MNHKYLKHVDHSPHIASTKLKDGLSAIRSELESLLAANVFDSDLCIREWDLLKFEAGASRLKRRDDLGHIVRDEAEPGVRMILFNDFIGSFLLLLRAN